MNTRFFPNLLSGLFFVLLLGGGWAGMAQAQSLKVAVVDLNMAMNEVEEGKAAIAKLEKRFNDKKDALERQGKEIQDLKADLDLKGNILSEEAKKDRMQQIQEKMMEFQQAQFDADQEMAGLRNQLQTELADKLREVCANIAKKQGYTLVVEKGVVWYSLPEYDITDQVIAAYNAKTRAAK